MKRGFLFFVTIITIIMFFFMNQQYYQTVSLTKQHFKSNQSIAEEIVFIEGEIIEGNIYDDYFIARITKVKGDKVDFKWRLYHYTKDNSQVSVDNLCSSFIASVNLNQIQFTSVKNKSGFDYDKYLYSKGITKQFKILELKPNPDYKRSSILTLKSKLYGEINTIIDSSLSGKSKELVRALILGDKTNFENYSMYKDLGLAHLFAISGLHFGIIYYFIKKCLSFLPYNASSIFSLIILIILLIVIGWPYSAQRAFYMILYNEFTQTIGRKKDVYMSVAFSLLIIILVQPHAVLSTSMYLSYYAYICVALLYKSIFKHKIKNKYLESLRFCIAIQLLLLPASLYFFQKINLYSFLSNLILVPIIGILLPLSLLYIIIALIGFKSHLLIFAIDKFVGIMNLIAMQMPLNLSAFVAFKQSDFLIIVCIILVYFLCHTIWRLYRERRKFLIYLAIALIFIFTCRDFNSSSQIQVISYDVGHGDMTLLKSKSIKILVDTGDGKNSCESILRGEGIHSIDALIITHAHQDHYGGALELINNMKIKYLILNDETYELLKDKISNTKVKIQIIKSHRLSIESIGILDENLTIEVIPIKGENYKDDPNENALIVKINALTYLGYILSDISTEMIDTIKGLDQVDFVKSAHHGSKTSFNTELYDSDALKLVLTSCSKKYNMPNIDFEKKLLENKINHTMTYRDGETIVNLSNGEIKVKTLLNSSFFITCEP